MYRAYVRVQKLTPGIFSIIAKYLVNICQGFFDEPFNASLISLGCYKVPFQKNLSLSLHSPKGNPKYRDITLYVERKTRSYMKYFMQYLVFTLRFMLFLGVLYYLWDSVRVRIPPLHIVPAVTYKSLLFYVRRTMFFPTTSIHNILIFNKKINILMPRRGLQQAKCL